MSQRKLITVVIPTYNHESYVIDCIESVLSQDYPSVELIVINDGSTDGTDEKIKQLIKEKNAPIKYISKSNEGVGKTMSLGLKEAKGEYFCEVCSDDLLTPGSITKRIDFLESNEKLDVVFGTLTVMDAKGNPIKESDYGKREKFDSDKHSFSDFATGNAGLTIHTGLFKTKFLKDVGGFDEDFYTEDVHMSYLVALFAKAKHIDEPVIMYRKHETNISNNKPIWMRKEKILSLEKLSLMDIKDKEKNIIKSFLFNEYLKYVKAGIKKEEDKKALKEALRKAMIMKPFSPSGLYCKLLLTFK